MDTNNSEETLISEKHIASYNRLIGKYRKLPHSDLSTICTSIACYEKRCFNDNKCESCNLLISDITFSDSCDCDGLLTPCVSCYNKSQQNFEIENNQNFEIENNQNFEAVNEFITPCKTLPCYNMPLENFEYCKGCIDTLVQPLNDNLYTIACSTHSCDKKSMTGYCYCESCLKNLVEILTK